MGLALRGTWDKDTRVEDGDFNFFIKWKSKFDAVLKTHLDTAPRNATYLSPQIQNGLIASIEEEIRKVIFSKISKSVFLSIMADETTNTDTLINVGLQEWILRVHFSLSSRIFMIPCLTFTINPAEKRRTMQCPLLTA